ncbi:MAG TPA: FkbM family methyltransferase [Candidatus Dormibacteraeota bacterium]|nr:FkbM family methyltransferase [Candidatus Dormibacteraeota bacterium]
MIKKLLTRAVGILPESAQFQIRERYWRAKSRILYQWLYGLLNLEHTLDSGLTVKVASKGEWWTYNDIFVNGEYDVPIQTALGASSGKPFVVLDLGANVGYFSFRVLDLIRRHHLDHVLPDITVVEGSPETFAKLESRIQSQQLAPASIRMVHGLVGQRTGSALIRESAVHVKTGIMDVPARGGTRVVFVDVNTLMKDKIEIDLLKCDIEGSELMFIENYGDLLQKVRHAVFELHHDQCDTKKCVGMLDKLGFRQTILRANDSFCVSFHSRG